MKDPAFPPRYLERWESLFTTATIERLGSVGHLPEEVTELLEGFVQGSK